MAPRSAAYDADAEIEVQRNILVAPFLHEGDDTQTLAVELGPRFDISWDPRGAVFAMTLGEYYCARLAAPVIVEVVRDGVVYARVYDLRGLSFTTLLRVPAP